MPKSRLIKVYAAILAALMGTLVGFAAAPGKSPSDYQTHITPILSRYCFACHGGGKHKGDLALDKWANDSEALTDSKTWALILQKLQAREMPPESKPQPAEKERQVLLSWIEKTVLRCHCDHPDPGRVTLRRLNRAEYNNTIRDLFGAEIKPAADFPVDDSGYGFDNIGDALSMPPVLFEKYLASAEQVLKVVLGPTRPMPADTERFPVDALEVGYNAKQRGDGWVALNTIEEDDVAVRYTVLAAGEYVVRVHAYARQESTNRIKLTFMRDRAAIRVVEVETNAAAAHEYEARVQLPAGSQRLRAVVRRIKDGLPEAEALKWKSGTQQKGAVLLKWLEVEGPLEMARSAGMEARRRSFLRFSPSREGESARNILGQFARKAWRRPVGKAELARLLDLAEAARMRCAADDPSHRFEEGIRVGLQAVLVSPHFLFRGELQPEPETQSPLTRLMSLHSRRASPISSGAPCLTTNSSPLPGGANCGRTWTAKSAECLSIRKPPPSGKTSPANGCKSAPWTRSPRSKALPQVQRDASPRDETGNRVVLRSSASGGSQYSGVPIG